MQEWKIRPMLATLCEHLFVNFSIRWLRKLVSKVIPDIELSGRSQKEIGTGSKIVPSSSKKETKTNRKWSVGGFLLSSVLAYLNGRLCRRIPNPITRRIVSGFMLSFVDNDSSYWSYKLLFFIVWRPCMHREFKDSCNTMVFGGVLEEPPILCKLGHFQLTCPSSIINLPRSGQANLIFWTMWWPICVCSVVLGSELLILWDL